MKQVGRNFYLQTNCIYLVQRKQFSLENGTLHITLSFFKEIFSLQATTKMKEREKITVRNSQY